MPQHTKKGREGGGKKEEKKSVDAGGSNYQRSKDPVSTGGYYKIKKGVCGILIDKNSEGGLLITTDPPTNFNVGDTGWEYIAVKEGTEIWGHTVFYLCYPS